MFLFVGTKRMERKKNISSHEEGGGRIFHEDVPLGLTAFWEVNFPKSFKLPVSGEHMLPEHQGRRF